MLEHNHISCLFSVYQLITKIFVYFVIILIGKPDSMEWARLETRTEETTSIQNFVQNIQSGAEKEGYLFDWSLPLFCPELYEELLLPPYFKDDYLKNVENSLYKSSWPSLFVAPKGT